MNKEQLRSVLKEAKGKDQMSRRMCFMKKITMIVILSLLITTLVTPPAFATDSWTQVSYDFVDYNGDKYRLSNDGENFYLQYYGSAIGPKIMLSDMDVQYRIAHDGGYWFVSIDAVSRAYYAYDNAKDDSEYILVDDIGNIYVSSYGVTYILKAIYVESSWTYTDRFNITITNDTSGFGVSVTVEGETTPKFWIGLQNDDFNVQDLQNGIKLAVSKLVVETAINSYEELLKFH